MFLKRLEIRGFKSFADRTIFDFSPGVSVIVGPNGSGKSNLVDAIAWVLGEQGPKTLRGGKMEDVIFAGTPKRQSLGRSEVELTIDNSAGVLPIEFTEVTLRRILFRSGESEYAINGVPCRLLDIQELLSDTGVGRELHTIVGQGQLDEILSGKPEERRASIEEAAGLLKHRRRKDRAVRKLERVDADVERLGDVIAELRRQIRPLERQAEIAKRAAEIEAELADARLKVWVLDYRAVTNEDDVEAERSAAEEVAHLAEASSSAAAHVEQIERGLSEASRAAEASLATGYRLGGLADRFEALGRFAEERRRHVEDLAAREPSDDAPAASELTGAEAALAEARAAREGAEHEAGRADRERVAVQSAREEAARAREEVVHLHGERAALRGALEGAEDERRRLADRRTAIERAIAENASALDEVRTSLQQLDAEETVLGERLAEAEGARDLQRAAVDALGEQERELERRVDALQARRGVLGEEAAGAEDPSSLIGTTPGITGRVIDQVRAPGYERALRAGLGPLADAVLAISRAEAMSALERLKRGGARATIAVPGASIYQPVPVGVRGLSSVVEAAGPHADLVRALVSGVGLAQTLAEAAELQHEYPTLVVVTVDGDRLGPNVVTGGAPIEARDPRVELRKGEEELSDVADSLASLGRGSSAARAEQAALEDRLGDLAARMNDLDASVAGATERLAQLEREAHGLARENSVLAGRIQEVSERLGDDGERLRAVESRLGRAVASEPPIDAMTLAQIEREAALRSLRLGEASERERAMQATLDGLRERARRVGEERARWEAGRNRWLDGAARAGMVAEAARRAGARLAEWAARARQDRTERDGRRRALEEQLSHARRVRGQAEVGLEEARTRAHEADLRRAERSHRIAALVERLRGEHAMAPKEALEAVRPEPGDEDDLRRRAATLERRLGLLGRVNPIAMEQYQELVDRHSFLTAQVDDLRRSRRDLMAVVEEVDRKIVEIFSAAFADVEREFAEVFSRLFPGGEGRLVLTEPDDLLNTGIDVEARPAGKRIKRVSLLSGGERALTSVALLFSIFRARPSPFYLLDEVEAALDDVNLHRFLELAQEFRNRSQLLIVTHQKRTMEIADALYGISMGGEGVSTVICQRLERPTETQARVDA